MESTVDIIKLAQEMNIPWVIRGNILTLLGEEQFVEFIYNETTEFVEHQFNNEIKEFLMVKLEVTQ